ncbi:unnamed protein product [Rotaria magnacalcarata]|uniref:Uncharacterized protein n=1 Tax=Rotaria magnacalcarata TaxID=392030 RepID=A0A815DF31_9BILA|nr:unnamed protein product [Rotaria magnacalcarata]CAF5169022.1 unnamed protein product [Rotaria magnacalcarata]
MHTTEILKKSIEERHKRLGQSWYASSDESDSDNNRVQSDDVAQPFPTVDSSSQMQHQLPDSVPKSINNYDDEDQSCDEEAEIYHDEPSSHRKCLPYPHLRQPQYFLKSNRKSLTRSSESEEHTTTLTISSEKKPVNAPLPPVAEITTILQTPSSVPHKSSTMVDRLVLL